MYAYFKKLDYFSTECIYSPNAYRGHARVFLKDLEAVRRTAIVGTKSLLSEMRSSVIRLEFDIEVVNIDSFLLFLVDIIHSGEALSASVQANESTKLPTMANCTRCGYISSNELCKACLLLEGLNRGLPQLGIGQTTKIRRMHDAAALNSTLASGLSAPNPTSSGTEALSANDTNKNASSRGVVVTHIKDLERLTTMPTLNSV